MKQIIYELQNIELHYLREPFADAYWNAIVRYINLLLISIKYVIE